MIVTPALDDQKATIANLIQLYLYDMTESMPFPVGPDGRFGYDFLDRFWQFPYLIQAGDEIAGFALVVDRCPLTELNPCHFMAEFFVLKAYRRRGIGSSAVHHLIARHPGQWHVGVPIQNRLALDFWRDALRPKVPVIKDLTFEGGVWRLHQLEG